MNCRISRKKNKIVVWCFEETDRYTAQKLGEISPEYEYWDFLQFMKHIHLHKNSVTLEIIFEEP
jgi:hypothetical protein